MFAYLVNQVVRAVTINDPKVNLLKQPSFGG